MCTEGATKAENYMKVVIDETFIVTEAVPIGTTLYGGRGIQALIANMKSINAGQ